MYIYSSTTQLRITTIIHQPKSIDVVITTPRALGRWSHSHIPHLSPDYPEGVNYCKRLNLVAYTKAYKIGLGCTA